MGKMKQKHPGPKPKTVSLYPLKFQEGVDILVGKKPKKKAEEILEQQITKNER